MNHEAINRILTHIEARSLDLTTPYENWLKLGFALSSLGESGRPYFHRLSRFNPEYDPAECDRQFSQCLESKGSGISLGSFFHMAREAGIPLSPTLDSEPPNTSGIQASEEEEPEIPEEKLPLLAESIYKNLPDFLVKTIAPAESPAERDVLLLGSLVTLSSCMPTIYGIYDGFEVFPNLYLYVTARASSGKGKLNLCKRLVLPIHMKKRAQASEMKVLYEAALADDAAEKPQKPQEKMLLLPANSSATGLFQLLSENEGRGLIFETEGDTLANTLKTEFGNYSDGFRKSFHHETISFYRRTDREYVDIQAPCLSTILSGTPAQVHGLIPSAENGLFSRFLFYHLQIDPVWKDTFRNSTRGELLDYYQNLGQEFLKFHEVLCKHPLTEVVLTEAQKDIFFEYFRSIQSRYITLIEDGFIATVRRMGLICFRLMMVFSSLRYLGTSLPYKIVCRDEDFDAAINIISTLLRHSNYVFNHLPVQKEVVEKLNPRVVLLKRLPNEFSSAQFVQMGSQLNISRSTSYRILKEFLAEGLILKQSFGNYCLASIQDLWGER